MKYALINEYEIEDLENEVNRALGKEWKVVGRAFFQGNKWFQTVIKEE